MIAYLGPKGTFSHTVAIDNCPGDELKEFPTIYSAIMSAAQGETDACIVPIENSIEGSVNTTLDTLAFDTELYITKEYILRIHQNILVKPGTKKEDIKRIISHPQAIGQCARILNTEFKNAEIVFSDSTASAAKAVSESDGSMASIGSLNCAEINNLDVLVPDCGDMTNNSTRFVKLERTIASKSSDKDKTSIVFALENRSGALYEALSIFERHKINLIKIESRPFKTSLGQYIFFVDTDGNQRNENIASALCELQKKTTFFKLLGSYEKSY